MEYPIDEKKKGLFVIVEQTDFNLLWIDSDKKRLVDFKDANKLHYKKDTEALIEVFGLKKPDLVYSSNLTSSSTYPEDSEKNKCFETFMRKVCSSERGNPEFVVFFLMSHGFENGVFLLAHEGKKVNGQLVSGKPCCRPSPQEEVKKHSLSGECYGRHVVKDVIQKVTNRYPGIPKIFIFQCCRGVESYNLKTPATSSNISSEIELFICNQPNTLVFWGSTETYVSYAPPDSGSLLVQSFCEAVRELQENKQLHEKLLKEVKRKPNNESKSLVERFVEERREDMTGGWLMNVCQRATALVTNKLLIDIILPETRIGKILAQCENNRVPHSKHRPNRLRMCGTFFTELSEDKASYQHLISRCTRNEDLQRRVFKYLWYNIRVLKSMREYYFDLDEPLRADLDKLIKELRDTHPAYKQQPHISSNLAKKVSIIKIFSTQGK